jgi:hypothetical protein
LIVACPCSKRATSGERYTSPAERARAIRAQQQQEPRDPQRPRLGIVSPAPGQKQ